MTPSSRMVDPVLQRSLCMWECLCATSEAHALANVVPSLLTSIACFTGQPDFQCYFVALFEPLYVRTHTNHYTS